MIIDEVVAAGVCKMKENLFEVVVMRCIRTEALDDGRIKS